MSNTPSLVNGRVPGVAGEARSAGDGRPHTALPLLATKLFVPQPRPDLVPRPRLLDRLHQGLVTGRCTLLSAPAGAGKTSLLAAWIAELDRPVCWLALDERDQDVSRFLRYLLAALQGVAPSVSRAAWFDGPPPPPESLLTELINELATRSTGALLVLDDYHTVHSPAVHSAIGFLVDHLPPGLHLVVAGREDPPLPLPRLRARGQLVELRAADLGFTVPEASALFGPGLGLELTDAQVGALVERTEGWAAGLQLAGLALRDRPDPAGFVREFAGGHRLVADYLAAEVLARQSDRVRHFLAATAWLDRLCGPLCDAVLADGPADGQRTLEELDRANLFLVPLDDTRSWYRYHHLFADALRVRLVGELTTEQVAAGHRRASTWFGNHGLLPEAIRHALAAAAVDGSAHEQAADLIEALIPAIFASVDIHHAMQTWLAALPEPLVRSRPLLCVGHAWLLINRLQIGPAAAWAEAADRALPAGSATAGDDPAVARAGGAVAAIRALLATLGPQPDPAVAGALAERALHALPAADVPFRGVAGVAFGQAAVAQGRPEEAERVLSAVAAEGRDAGLVHGALVVAGHLVAVQRLSGARRRALVSGRVALAWAAGHGSPATPGLGTLSVLLADLLTDGNELAEALPLAVEGHRMLGRFPDRPPLVVLAALAVARLRLYHGDPDAATAVLDPVRPLLARGPYVALLPLIDAADAQIRLATGDAAGAVAWARATELGTLPNVFRLQTHVLAAGLAALLVTPAAILVAHGRATGDAGLLRLASERLDAAAAQSGPTPLGWVRLRAAILRALIADGLGDAAGAAAALAAAVVQAEREGVVRPFLDAGPPMPALLASARVRAAAGAAAGYLDVLGSAFSGTAAPARPRPPGPATPLIEPLTTRELEVLRLLAAGRSNAGMARLLIVEQSTIKTHLVHLYGKLGVHSRTQAVARAHALRLLD